MQTRVAYRANFRHTNTLVCARKAHSARVGTILEALAVNTANNLFHFAPAQFFKLFHKNKIKSQ